MSNCEKLWGRGTATSTNQILPGLLTCWEECNHKRAMYTWQGEAVGYLILVGLAPVGKAERRGLLLFAPKNPS